MADCDFAGKVVPSNGFSRILLTVFTRRHTVKAFERACKALGACVAEIKRNIKHRLGRSAKDLLYLVDFFTKRGVRLVSKKESIDTETPQGKFMLTIFSAISELERDTIKQRQLEGIAVAKAENKYKGRKPIEVDETKFKRECAKWRAGQQTAVQTFNKLGLKKNTFYKMVKEFNV